MWKREEIRWKRRKQFFILIVIGERIIFHFVIWKEWLIEFNFFQLCTPDIRFKFGRSNSHSHTSARSVKKSSNSASGESTVCHKSLPDLHTSTRRRASLSPRASTKSSSKPLVTPHHQSGGNCPDCETSSDYSDLSFKRDSMCYRR